MLRKMINYYYPNMKKVIKDYYLNKFVLFIETFLLDGICEYLFPDSYFSLNYDMYNLMLCSVKLSKLLLDKFLKKIMLTLPLIRTWDVDKKKIVQRIFVSSFDTMKEIPLNVKEICFSSNTRYMNNISIITFKNL